MGSWWIDKAATRHYAFRHEEGTAICFVISAVLKRLMIRNSVASAGLHWLRSPRVVRQCPAPAPQRKQHTAVWVLLGVLLIVIVWAVAFHPNFPGAKQTQVVPPQQPQIRLYTNTFNKAITIPALGSTFVSFTLPDGSSNVRLQGHFAATGGIGNDIEVYLLNEDEFANWENGHVTQTIYNSGRVTQDSPNVNVPTSAGTYYLVFNNKFSLLTPKAVEANLTFTYLHQ